MKHLRLQNPRMSPVEGAVRSMGGLALIAIGIYLVLVVGSHAGVIGVLGKVGGIIVGIGGCASFYSFVKAC